MSAAKIIELNKVREQRLAAYLAAASNCAAVLFNVDATQAATNAVVEDLKASKAAYHQADNDLKRAIGGEQ